MRGAIKPNAVQRQLGPAGCERLAAPALALSAAAGVEVVVHRQAGGVARFANSQIHQNTWAEDVLVNVRAVTADGRVGVAGAHTDDPAQVAATAEAALAIARVSPVDGAFPGLAPSAATRAVPVDHAIVEATPEHRAAAVRTIVAELPSGLEAAGAFSTVGAELAVFTTAGQRAYTPVSSTQLTLVVIGPSSSGYAEAGGRTLDEVDPVAVARTAAAKARAAAEPVDVVPGEWAVVLEPAATNTLVQFLAVLGFGGKAYLEGRAFTTGRMGGRVAAPAVTIVDDALSGDTVGVPFDFEGTPKQRVDLLRDGFVAGVVHDRHTAAQAGVASTGHGLLAPNPAGPVALNPLLRSGGDGRIDDLVGGLERGLLVTRFHYTNVVEPMNTVLTGMTRDGTFLVEDGRVTAAVRNLRFTQSILGALAEVDAISSETGYASELFFGGSRCPALRLPAFSFTGTTNFG